LLSAMLLVQGIAFVFLHNMLPVSYYDSQERAYIPALTYEPHWHALDRAFEWIRATPNQRRQWRLACLSWHTA
jgi:hypothetical protein